MYPSRERERKRTIEEEPPALSPPPTPPGFTKYYLYGSPTPEDFHRLELEGPPVYPGMETGLMVDEEEGEDEEDERIILDRSPSEPHRYCHYPYLPPPLPQDEGGRAFCSITIRRGMNRYCGGLIALLSLLLLITCLLEVDRSRRDNGQFHQAKNNNHLGGTLFGSLMGEAWTRIAKGGTATGRDRVLEEPPSINKIKRLPQCIIIGARKCGTRALIDMLNLHPQVKPSRRTISQVNIV